MLHPRHIFAAVGGAAAAAALSAAPALADTPVWTCSASALTINVGGASGGTLDPVHAGDPAVACGESGSNLPSLSLTDPLAPASPGAGNATSGTVYARARLIDAGAPVRGQAPRGESGIEGLSLSIGGGQLQVDAGAVTSAVSGACNGTTPGFTSSGVAANLKINGQEITGDTEIQTGLNQLGATPLSGLVRVGLNGIYPGGTPGTADETLVREGVRIELLSASGSPVETIVIARSQAGRHGDVCAPATSTPGGNGSGGTNTNTNTTTPGSNTNGGGANPNAGGTAGVGASAPSNGTNASSCARLSMFFAPLHGSAITKSGPRAITNRFGVRRVTRGRIVNCKGKPIIKARIDVYHVIRGKKKAVKTGLRSRGNGELTLILPNNIGTRDVVFQYRPNTKSQKVAARKTLKITVKDRRGRTVR